MIEALRYGFSNYFNFSGETGRRLFWLWVLGIFVITFVLSLIDVLVIDPALGVPASGENVQNPLAWLFSLIVIIPNIAMGIRRLRDGGYSPWLMLLGLIPFVNLILIYFFVQPSKGDAGS